MGGGRVRIKPGDAWMPLPVSSSSELRPVPCPDADNPISMTMPRTTAAASESADSGFQVRRPSVPLLPGARRYWPILVPFMIASFLPHPNHGAHRPSDRRRPGLDAAAAPTCGQPSNRSHSFPNLHPSTPPAPPSGSARPLFSCSRAPSARPNDLSRKIRHASLQIAANLGRHD